MGSCRNEYKSTFMAVFDCNLTIGLGRKKRLVGAGKVRKQTDKGTPIIRALLLILFPN